MSLLMKALEKAARDRGEARTESEAAASATVPRPEVSLALELLAADTPSPRLQEDERRDTAASQSSGRGPFRDESPARAATVLRAGNDAEGGVRAYLRDHPLLVFGGVAALFAMGFGGYVYLQIFHPALFLRQVPTQPSPATIVTAPQKAPSAPPIPTAPGLKSFPLALSRDAGERQPVAPAPARNTPLSSAEATPKPSPASTSVRLATSAAQAPEPPVDVRPAPKAESSPGKTAIVVKRGEAVPSVNPALAEGYSALVSGRLDIAEQFYSQVARTDPNSVDALLGLAAIAVQEGRTEVALRYYGAILTIDPRHVLAQSGLISLTGRADPIAAESRLKLLIAREPSAFLYFTLGNLYADQSLWAQAQQAYFQAHQIEPQNPEYAYNLAVGLEHISQPRLAIGFYRRAVELSATRAHVNFDPVRARERVAALATQLEQ